MTAPIDKEIFYLAIVCSLLIVPRILQRFRIPAPLTCMMLGIVVALQSPDSDGPIVRFAAILGISSLFLFAGLEVKFSEMRDQARPLIVFAVLRVVALVALTVIVQQLLNVPLQPACLISLALLTSSTGFILDSLDQFGIEGTDRPRVANEAIVGEVLALGILFFVLQFNDARNLAFATGSLLAMTVAIPAAYYAITRWILPYAPESEFSLLVMVAIVAGFVTSRLGVEYLLGAFLAGVMASQMSKRVSLLETPDAMNAVKLFSSFFMPFYFFQNGSQIAHETLSADAIKLGVAFSLLVPLRWLVVWLRYKLRNDASGTEMRLALSLLPTLIFTLVLGQILRERFGIDETIIGALYIYAFVSTLAPSLFLHKRS